MAGEEELDFEIIEDNAEVQVDNDIETNEEIIPSDDESKDDNGEDTSPAKSKKSNWKKMVASNKKKDKRISDLEAKLSKEYKKPKKSEIYEYEYKDDGDLEDEISYDKTEFRFFLVEEEWARNYRKDMEDVLQKYPNMPFQDALDFAKAKTPPESKSSNNFSTKWSNTKVRKRMSDITEDEALQLPSDKYLKYQKKKCVKV